MKIEGMTIERAIYRTSNANWLTIAAADAMRPKFEGDVMERRRLEQMWREIVVNLVHRYPHVTGKDFLDLRWDVIRQNALSRMAARVLEDGAA